MKYSRVPARYSIALHQEVRAITTKDLVFSLDLLRPQHDMLMAAMNLKPELPALDQVFSEMLNESASDISVQADIDYSAISEAIDNAWSRTASMGRRSSARATAATGPTSEPAEQGGTGDWKFQSPVPSPGTNNQQGDTVHGRRPPDGGTCTCAIRRLINNGQSDEVLELIEAISSGTTDATSVSASVSPSWRKGSKREALSRCGEVKLFFHKQGFLIQIDPIKDEDLERYDHKTLAAAGVRSGHGSGATRRRHRCVHRRQR